MIGLIDMSDPGWIIARCPSNSNFTLHKEISRPIVGYEYRDEARHPVYGKGPACYNPVRIKLVAKNQYTKQKNEARTEIPLALLPGYIFIRDPDPKLIQGLIDRKRIYDVIPAPARKSNNFEPAPLRLSQAAITLMRDRYGAEFDVDTGAGHRVTTDPRARMQAGYEFEVGDYVLSDDPAWQGHQLRVTAILDRTARVICSMFGINHEVEVDLWGVRKG